MKIIRKPILAGMEPSMICCFLPFDLISRDKEAMMIVDVI